MCNARRCLAAVLLLSIAPVFSYCQAGAAAASSKALLAGTGTPHENCGPANYGQLYTNVSSGTTYACAASGWTANTVRYVSNAGDLGASIQAAVTSLAGPGEIVVNDGGGTATTIPKLGPGQKLSFGVGVYRFPQVLVADSQAAAIVGSQIAGKGEWQTTLECMDTSLACVTSPNTESLIREASKGNLSFFGAAGTAVSHLTILGGKYNYRVYGQHQSLEHVNTAGAVQDGIYIEHNEDVQASVPNLPADNLTTLEHIRVYGAGHNALTLAGKDGQYDSLVDVTAVRYGCWGVESSVPMSWHQGFTVGIGTKVCGGLHLQANSGLKGDDLELGSDAGNGILEDLGVGGVILSNSLIAGNLRDASTAPAAVLSGTGNVWSNVQISGAQIGLKFGKGGGGSFSAQFQGNVVDIACDTMSYATMMVAHFNGASRHNLDPDTCGTAKDGYRGVKGTFFAGGVLLLTKLPTNTLTMPAGQFGFPEIEGTLFDGGAPSGPYQLPMSLGTGSYHFLGFSHCHGDKDGNDVTCPGDLQGETVHSGGSTAEHLVCTADGKNCPVLAGSLTTTSSVSDSAVVNGMTASGHCTFSPTNASAARDVGAGTVYLSAKAANRITLTHAGTPGETFDIRCTPY